MEDLQDNIEKMPGRVFHDTESLASIESRALSIEDEDTRDRTLYVLVERLIREWLLDDAERITTSVTYWRIESTWLYGQIAECLVKLGQKTRAIRLLEKATPIARSTGMEWQRAASLSKLAKHYANIGQVETAIHLWEEAIGIAQAGEQAGEKQDEVDASSVLWEIAEELALLGQWAYAKRVANDIRSPGMRERAITRIETMYKLAHPEAVTEHMANPDR
jgi:tetratricopeptide (TPR) repeat protein